MLIQALENMFVQLLDAPVEALVDTLAPAALVQVNMDQHVLLHVYLQEHLHGYVHQDV